MKTFMIMPQKTHANRLKRGRKGGEKICKYVRIIILILALDQGQRLVSRSSPVHIRSEGRKVVQK